MKKVKWILISVTGILALVGGGGWLALRSWIEKNATPEAIVRRVEAEWNCRAEVKSVDVSLWSNPARIVLSQFRLSPRDGEVTKPLAQRASAEGGPGLLTVSNAALEADTNALASGKLHIKKLALSGVWMREEITPEGVSIMKEAFRKPDPAGAVTASPPTITLDETPVAAAPAAPSAAPKPKKVEDLATPLPEAPASASTTAATEKRSSLPFGIVIDEAVLEKADFRIRNRQARTTSNLNNLNLRITDVDVDSSNLKEHNQCKVEIRSMVDSSGRAKVGDETKDILFANFEMAATGVIQPMDETTGEFSPAGKVTLQLKKGGVFGGTQTFGEAAAKDKSFAKMKEYGLDVSDLKIGGALQEDVVAEAAYQQGRVQFLKDVLLVFPDYSVLLRAGSWVNGAEDDHDMQLRLVPSEAVAKKLKEDAAAKVGDGLVKLAENIFKDEQGRLTFDIVSSDRLSKPKIRLGGQAGVIEGLLRGLIK